MPDSSPPADSPVDDQVLTESATDTPDEEADDFVDAELVPDPPSPFAFGMKAMFGLMAISAVQFALMSWLGPLLGLVVGIGLCMVAMAVLMVSSVIMGIKPGQQAMDQMDRIAIRLVVGIVVLFFGTILAGGGQMVLMVVEDVRFQWRMQSDLGFTYVTKTVYDDRADAVLEITSVTANGAFDEAGLQKGDLILLNESTDSFLRKLEDLRGQSIDIPVANYEASTGETQVDETTERSVTVQIPE